MLTRARVGEQSVVVIVVLMAVGGWGVLHALPSSHPFATGIHPPSEPLLYTADVVKSYPHDPNAFTQGLVYYRDNILYESTGMYGESSVREVNLDDGKVAKEQKDASKVFGEGLVLVGERLSQLTWQTRKGFKFNRKTLKEEGEFEHPMTDGWGFAYDGRNLIGSDGTSTLYFLDPDTYRLNRSVSVLDGKRAVANLNELEFIHGEVWANIWQTDCIAQIDPISGQVKAWMYLAPLRQNLYQEEAAKNTVNLDPNLGSQNVRMDVLNGIAWDPAGDRVFVTGKWWAKLYEIKPMRRLGSSASDIEGVRSRCIRS